MCGIGAFLPSQQARANTPLITRLVQATLLSLERRGTDSTGIAAIMPDGQVRVLKSPQRASVFLLTANVSEWIAAQAQHKPLGWLLHTRAATVGEVNHENSHPLQNGGVTLVHNGHVSNYTSLKPSFKLKTTCDSEVIAAALAKAKLGAYAAQIERLMGNFAILAHDRRVPRTLLVGRTSNPINVIRSGADGVMLASMPLASFVEPILAPIDKGVLTKDAEWKVVPSHKQYLINLDTLAYTQTGDFNPNTSAMIIGGVGFVGFGYVDKHERAWKESVMPGIALSPLGRIQYVNATLAIARGNNGYVRQLKRLIKMGFSQEYIRTHEKALMCFLEYGQLAIGFKHAPTFLHDRLKEFTHGQPEATNGNVAESNSDWRVTSRRDQSASQAYGSVGEARVDPLRRPDSPEARHDAWLNQLAWE